MNSITKPALTIEEKIREIENDFGVLQDEIQEIGLPAAQDLQRRLEDLKASEQAVRRELVEYLLDPNPNPGKVRNIECLLRQIAEEESSVKDDADFLNQAAPSSVSLAVEAGAHLIDLYRRGLGRLFHDRHPLGQSVFVNQTHDDLATRFRIDGSGDSAKVVEDKH